MSSSTVAYCLRGIVQYLDGNTKEFDRYVDKAMEINKSTPQLSRCKFKTNGKWIAALINWNTGSVMDLQGNILRRGIKS